jgi:hypothetical protein
MAVNIDTETFADMNYRLVYMKACIGLLENEIKAKKNSAMEKEWKLMKKSFDKIFDEFRDKTVKIDKFIDDMNAPEIITRFCRFCQAVTKQKKVVSHECMECNKNKR